MIVKVVSGVGVGVAVLSSVSEEGRSGSGIELSSGSGMNSDSGSWVISGSGSGL